MTGGEGSDIFVMTGGKDTVTDFHPKAILPVPASDAVVDFQGLTFGAHVPNGYKNLNWAETISFEPFSLGYTLVKDGPGDFVGFTEVGTKDTAMFSSPAADFDLISLDISGGYTSTLNVVIQVYDDGGVAVGSVALTGAGRVTVDFTNKVAYGAAGSPVFTGRFTSIDEVRLVPQSGNNLAFDDIKIHFPAIPSADPDKIDVPEFTNIDALIASAVSDGHGGTLLSIPAQTYIGRDGKTYTSQPASSLDLVGVDPNTVSADWFI